MRQAGEYKRRIQGTCIGLAMQDVYATQKRKKRQKKPFQTEQQRTTLETYLAQEYVRYRNRKEGRCNEA